MSDSQNFEQATATIEKLTSGLSAVVRGRSDTISLILTGLLADGHVLIEDYPGSGKTTLAKVLGNLIDCSDTSNNEIIAFRRVQFTPDLLPSDVLGVNIFEPKTSSFRFQHGPIFAHIVLADEINRTGPKVQAAFLECMAERQVTIDNNTYPLDDLFFVIGTQNPLDLAGTYPLPLVQLDRFLLKIPMQYVDRESEIEILNEAELIKQKSEKVTAVVSRREVLEARTTAQAINLNPTLVEAIVDIVQSTRNHSLLQFGASTRSAIMLKHAIQAYALINGRDYATEDDLKTIAPSVLMHRLRFHPGAGDPNDAFQEILAPHLEKLISTTGKSQAA